MQPQGPSTDAVHLAGLFDRIYERLSTIDDKIDEKISEANSQSSARIAEMDGRIDVLSESISKLEGQLENRKKGILEQIGAYGGLLALVISIALGARSIYSEYVEKPEIDRKLAAQEIRQTVGDLSQIAMSILDAQSKNPAAATAVANTLAAKRLGLIRRARELFSQYPGYFDFPDHLLMANELLLYTRIQEATEHANNALRLASDPAQRANAYLLLARIQAFPGLGGDIAIARENFKQAANAISKESMYTAAWTLLSIKTELLMFEAVVAGECGNAEKILSEIKYILSRKEVFPQTKEMWEGSFAQLAVSLPPDCKLAP